MVLSHSLIRWEIALLIFTGLIMNYSLRLNLSIAIVKMANSTVHIGSLSKDLAWDTEERNYLLSGFFYGYVVMQVPGGRLAEVYGTKRVFGITMVFASALAALTPLATYLDLWAVFALRLIQGVLTAVTFPSLNPMTTRWAPEKERNRFMSFAYMGGTAGTVLTYPLCGWLLSWAPWEWVFYSTSLLSLCWCVLWFLLAHDLPEDHPRISPEERSMILAERSFDPVAREAELATPTLPLLWTMLSTPAVLTVMVTDFCCGWGNAMVITMTPTFMKEVLGYDIAGNGAVSMLPHLSRAIVGQIAGSLSDFLLRSGCRPLPLQKTFQALSFLVPAIGLVAISQLSTFSLRWYCVAAMTISYGFQGAQYSGHYANIITIGPNRSGTTFGLVNCAGNLPGFLMPIVLTAFTKDDPSSPESWGHAFWLFAALYALGTIVFFFSASGQVQPFNSITFEGEKEDEPSPYSSLEDQGLSPKQCVAQGPAANYRKFSNAE